MAQQTAFGTVPSGLSFKMEGDDRVWFKGHCQNGYTFKEDGNTKVHMDFIPFDTPVAVLTADDA